MKKMMTSVLGLTLALGISTGISTASAMESHGDRLGCARPAAQPQHCATQARCDDDVDVRLTLHVPYAPQERCDRAESAEEEEEACATGEIQVPVFPRLETHSIKTSDCDYSAAEAVLRSCQFLNKKGAEKLFEAIGHIEGQIKGIESWAVAFLLSYQQKNACYTTILRHMCCELKKLHCKFEKLEDRVDVTENNIAYILSFLGTLEDRELHCMKEKICQLTVALEAVKCATTALLREEVEEEVEEVAAKARAARAAACALEEAQKEARGEVRGFKRVLESLEQVKIDCRTSSSCAPVVLPRPPVSNPCHRDRSPSPERRCAKPAPAPAPHCGPTRPVEKPPFVIGGDGGTYKPVVKSAQTAAKKK